uniref:DNA2/NAM7 helicase helicase domain-containing protein n=1 Tax=Oryza barthii TaxID=65489 RepID=A0A0D3HG54_9ORYZ
MVPMTPLSLILSFPSLFPPSPSRGPHSPRRSPPSSAPRRIVDDCGGSVDSAAVEEGEAAAEGAAVEEEAPDPVVSGVGGSRSGSGGPRQDPGSSSTAGAAATEQQRIGIILSSESSDDKNKCGDELINYILSWSWTTCIESNFENPQESAASSYAKSLSSVSLQKLCFAPQFKIIDILPAAGANISFLDIDLQEVITHNTERGDIFLLCTELPRDSCQLCNDEAVLAMATCSNLYDTFQRSFNVKIHQKVKETKIWESLNAVILYDCPIINDLLTPPSMITLDEVQLEAAKAIYSAARCKHSRSIHVISGAHGTGKTKIVFSAVASLLSVSEKVIVCVPNAQSFSAMCSDFVEMAESHMDEELGVCLGDILVLSNETGLEDNVQQLTIITRVKEVLPLMIWHDMMKALREPLAAFKEKYAASAKKHDCQPSAKKLLSSLVFEKARFLLICLATLRKHFPKNMFSEQVRKRIKSLIKCVSKLENLLKDKDLKEYDVHVAFGILSGKRETISVLAKDLRQTKNHCVTALDDLLTRLDLPFNKDCIWLRNYFISNAKCVLCTPLSTFDLQLSAGSIETLIVDNADQIRDYDLILPLTLRDVKNIVLTGDPSKVKEGSFFQRLLSVGFSVFELRRQYNLLDDKERHEADGQKTLPEALNDKIKAEELSLTIGSPKQLYSEFTWLHCPYNQKYILPQLRDQKGHPHCTVHASLAALEFKYKYKAASENPPHDFSSKFCTKHMLNVYAAKYGELGSERESTRGSKRLSNVLDILQNDGAKREAMMGKQVYKISSYACTYKIGKDTECLQETIDHLKIGDISIGSFKVSENLRFFKPGEVYIYNPEKPVLTSTANQPSAHCVLVIGGGGCPNDSTAEPVLACNMQFMIQNSYGKGFGELGIGRVRGDSFSTMHRISL